MFVHLPYYQETQLSMSSVSAHNIPEWVFTKMKNYCVYQERCLMDVKHKLRQFQLQEKVYESILSKLIKENYLNEERFAKVFASGKFRINKWGKSKIYKALQQKQIPELFILEGLNEIDDKEYIATLKEIILKKEKELSEPDFTKRNRKLAKFAISKGYEPNFVWKVLNFQDLFSYTLKEV